MKNVYDIRFEKQLTYILDPYKENKLCLESVSDSRAVIMLYLYYEDTLGQYYSYIDNIPNNIDICLVSSVEKVLTQLKERYGNRTNVSYVIKENAGRDVSALLIVGKELISKYEYVCFVHDKKEKQDYLKEEVALWIKNLWGNMIGHGSYIYQIIELFDKYENLGVLAPPDPIGDHFSDWHGGGWEGSFGATDKLARLLQLHTELSEDKPPVSLGTVFWLRSDSVKKIFEYDWTYEQFDDEKLVNSEYLSYGVERIFPYVAQDAGYDTGEIMTLEYAMLQMNYLKYTMPELLNAQMIKTPFVTLADTRKAQERIAIVKASCIGKDKIYLYGSGKMGEYLLWCLLKENIEVSGFIHSKAGEEDRKCNLPIFMADEFLKQNTDIHVIVTPYLKKNRNEMLKKLEEYEVKSFEIFWDN